MRDDSPLPERIKQALAVSQELRVRVLHEAQNIFVKPSARNNLRQVFDDYDAMLLKRWQEEAMIKAAIELDSLAWKSYGKVFCPDCGNAHDPYILCKGKEENDEERN